MAARLDWANAFACQARSDWRLYEALGESDHSRCHELHYLQMACEKIAKAYRIRDTDANLEQIALHHVGFVRFVRSFLLSAEVKQGFTNNTARLQGLLRGLSRLAREIELLAPAVDRDRRRDNAEYPWESGGLVIAPCEYDFPNLAFLSGHEGRRLLKLIRRAMNDYERIKIC